MPYKTLEGWEAKGLTTQGKLLIQAHIELKTLEKKHEIELEQYKEKAKKFEAIQIALGIA